MNRKRNSKLFMLCVLLISIIGCTKHTPALVMSSVPSSESASTSSKSASVFPAAETTIAAPEKDATSLQPLHGDVLPSLQVRAADHTKIPVAQSSYCWGNKGCADFVGGAAMLKGQSLPAIKAGASVQLHFPYTPAPSMVELTQYPIRASEDTSTIHVHSIADHPPMPITLHDGAFQAPHKAGYYYYEFNADWMSADGEHATGQTSFVFGFQVE
ncbi:hypothetical protein [Paenibacillus wenxiniae]|uniref:Lipoprotein n=1 Tax=Paenibacillus wenxiniae TaxID=1636843 RepID=A0ABW4RFI0_9BACL